MRLYSFSTAFSVVSRRALSSGNRSMAALTSETPVLEEKRLSGRSGVANTTTSSSSPREAETTTTSTTTNAETPVPATLPHPSVWTKGVGAPNGIVSVVIIGAGPTGLTLAADLARRGVSFTVFDVNAAPTGQSNAVLLDWQSLEFLSSLGVGAEIKKQGRELTGVAFHVNNKPTPLITIPFERQRSFISIQQSKLEKILIDSLENRHSIRVVRPAAVWKMEIPPSLGSYEETEVSKLPSILTSIDKTNYEVDWPSRASPLASENQPPTPTDVLFTKTEKLPETAFSTKAHDASSTPNIALQGSGVLPSLCTVHVKLLDFLGRPSEDALIHCHYVVGCDGAKSSLARALAIPTVPKGVPVEYLAADVDVEWGLSSLAPDRLNIIQMPMGALLLTPLPEEGRWRVMCTRSCDALSVDPYAPLDVAPDPDELKHIINTLVPGSVLKNVVWVAAYCVQPRSTVALRRGSALLVGDAAHVLPPSLGHGLNAGIQDAANLGWKLGNVVEGANPLLLDTYCKERREVVDSSFGAATHVLDFLIKPGAGVRCLLNVAAPLLASPGSILTTTVAQYIAKSPDKYWKSPVVDSTTRLGKAEPGTRCEDLVLYTLSESTPASQQESILCASQHINLRSVLDGSGHSLLLFLRVLPAGTKAKTLFGCERREEAPQWNATCLHKLLKLGRMLGALMLRKTPGHSLARTPDPSSSSSSFAKEMTTFSDVLSSTFPSMVRSDAYGVRNSENFNIIWILCGLKGSALVESENYQSRGGSGVPRRLVNHLANASTSKLVTTRLFLDVENHFTQIYGINLTEPDAFYGDDRSGGFLLVRPDAHLVTGGFAGDVAASSFAFDYVLSWLAKEAEEK